MTKQKTHQVVLHCGFCNKRHVIIKYIQKSKEITRNLVRRGSWEGLLWTTDSPSSQWTQAETRLGMATVTLVLGMTGRSSWGQENGQTGADCGETNQDSLGESYFIDVSFEWVMFWVNKDTELERSLVKQRNVNSEFPFGMRKCVEGRFLSPHFGSLCKDCKGTRGCDRCSPFNPPPAPLVFPPGLLSESVHMVRFAYLLFTFISFCHLWIQMWVECSAAKPAYFLTLLSFIRLSILSAMCTHFDLRTFNRDKITPHKIKFALAL